MSSLHENGEDDKGGDGMMSFIPRAWFIFYDE